MAKFKIATPTGASFTTAGGGYDYEMEPLEGIDAEIVEGPADEDGFIKFAQDADVVYAKGMRFTKKVVDGLPKKCRAIVLGSVGVDSVDVAGWQLKLDARGQKALVAALYTSEWAYYAEHETTGWWFASPTGLAMLGLGPPPPMPELATVFKAQPDLSVFAGAGLGREALVPLFRHAAIKRIDQVYEFRLDRKRLAGSPSGGAPGEELREAPRALDPLPPSVADLLATTSKVGGKVGIRWCSALVKPESAEVLAAIREHPKLKGYLEPGAPPGYLLIKSRSDPGNFVQRCQDLGLQVETL